jgi:two-component system CheB/CheR fusion protein
VDSFRLGKEVESFLLVFLNEGEDGVLIEKSSFDLKSSIQRIVDLEEELRMNKIRLKEVSEELEASNEELQTSNEELQASNEELQSINEEVESVNEELQTVNNECQRKITELTKANEDLDNFVASADIATIFLDLELRIRRFTPAAAKKANLLPHDIGRSITDLSHPLLVMASTAAKRILEGVPKIESVSPFKEEQIIMRATPFIQIDGKCSGATVSFITIGLLDTE